MDNDEMICFEMIASFGSASAAYMEAIHLAKQKQYELAQKAMIEGEDAFHEGHKVHAGLLQKFANNEKIEVSLLLMHAEDQMMNVEILKLLAIEVMELYKVVHSLLKD